MRRLIDEFYTPLDKVQRAWIRVPVTLILTPLVLVIAVSIGIINAIVNTIEDFTLRCLRGPR